MTTGVDLPQIFFWGEPKYWGQEVVITGESMDVSQL